MLYQGRASEACEASALTRHDVEACSQKSTLCELPGALLRGLQSMPGQRAQLPLLLAKLCARRNACVGCASARHLGKGLLCKWASRNAGQGEGTSIFMQPRRPRIPGRRWRSLGGQSKTCLQCSGQRPGTSAPPHAL